MENEEAEDSKKDSPFLETEKLEEDLAASCTYGGTSYPGGAKICYNHYSYTCGTNGWYKNGATC
ncbi:hypothetical protein [Mucilaginibacter sp.]|jgi:hypothetical protein|uniref:hypothetical protein n=1 Tax=Mucilaginibacter sp. TaxID=1882438 RepID=UPI0035616A2F